MKFKGFKVGEHYLTRYQLETMKLPGQNTPIPVDSVYHEECYSETVDGIETELVCDRKTFSFPVYRPNLDKMCDGRSKKRGNGEPVDFDLLFQDKRNRKALIVRIDEWQDPETNNYIGPNLQCYMTPEKIIKDMCSQFEQEFNNFTTSEFWVMFNLEFIDELVFERNVKRSRVKFFTDNVIKAKWAVKMYGVESYVINVDEFLNQDKIMPKSNKIIVIGNPPYQTQTDKQKLRDIDGADQTKPLYDKFVTTIIDNINPNKFTPIIPSKWMSGGMGLDTFRLKMMNDCRIKSINHFSGAKEVFKSVEIGGGVNYFLWESEYSGPCSFSDGNTVVSRYLNEFEIILQDNTACSIIRKVKEVSEKFVSEKVCSRKPFGLASNHSKFSDTGIRCYVVDKSEKFVSPDKFVDTNNILNKYKVCMAGASGFFREAKYTVGNPFIIKPNEICTETYIVINSFETENEAKNFVVYAHTKFFKFLLWQMLTTQNNSRKCYNYVPDQEDYSRSYNDEYLYQKYNLSQEQIEYIESKIKTIP